MKLAAVVIACIALFWRAHAYPQCGPVGSPDFMNVLGSPDPQTCDGPIAPFIDPKTGTFKQIPFDEQLCHFGLSQINGTWYQQWGSNKPNTPGANWQQGESCIQVNYDVRPVPGAAYQSNFTSITYSQHSNGSFLSYKASGRPYAVINFPGKLTTLYPIKPDLFPVLAYSVGEVVGTGRTQYVVRHKRNEWIIFSDFGCQTYTVLTKNATMSAQTQAEIKNATDSLYYGNTTWRVHQGSDCWYANGGIPTTPSTSSTGTSSTSTGASSTSTSTGTSSTGTSSSGTTATTSTGTTSTGTASTGTSSTGTASTGTSSTGTTTSGTTSTGSSSTGSSGTSSTGTTAPTTSSTGTSSTGSSGTTSTGSTSTGSTSTGSTATTSTGTTGAARTSSTGTTGAAASATSTSSQSTGASSSSAKTAGFPAVTSNGAASSTSSGAPVCTLQAPTFEVGPTSVLVRFSASCNKRAPREYSLQQSQNGGPFVTIFTTSDSSWSHEVTGLTTGTPYAFRVCDGVSCSAASSVTPGVSNLQNGASGDSAKSPGMAGWLIAVIVVVCVVALVAIVVAVVMIRSHRRSRPAEELPVADGAPPATTPEAAAPGGGLRNSLKSVTVLRNSGNAASPKLPVTAPFWMGHVRNDDTFVYEDDSSADVAEMRQATPTAKSRELRSSGHAYQTVGGTRLATGPTLRSSGNRNAGKGA
eukprot:TRINITY_DN743_c0_g1_i4.p1 TRINITY_DN743_c0_g1~~TRINITY_DN743_c0_g1_i4.p1  ORF type:complete len:696 (-),score=182.15 TRINITY_DN743_c0_g1_i4:632-2719(-)